ncbi:MAG TPA: hypothetical protein VGE11_18250 [Pseudonocardia sp.]
MSERVVESNGAAANGLAADERQELERLRAEVTALRAAPPPVARPRRSVRWASIGSAMVLALGLLLIPVSVLAIWTNNQISDSERFVATVSPIAEDPTVQSALADRITTEILSRVDIQQTINDAVDALAAQGVPPRVVDRLHDLTGPLADGARGFVRGKIGELVASPAFVQAVHQSTDVVHQQLQTVLSGQSSAIAIQGSNAVLDLYPFIEAAKQQLVASGFTAAAKIPAIHPTVDLFPASTLVRAQTAYRLLDAAATWLPWLTLLILVGGVLLARRKRRAVVGVGLGVMGVMVLLAAALLVTRGLLVGSVAEQAAAPTAAVYDILVRFLRTALRTLFVVGLVIALGAFLTGPAQAAVRLRELLSRMIGQLRGGSGIAGRLQDAGVGPWVHEHRGVLRTGVVLLAGLVVIFMDRPSSGDILVVALLVVVLLGVIEFLNQPRPPQVTHVGDDHPVPIG